MYLAFAMIRTSRTTVLSVGADAAFAWHTRPGAFERLIPPWEHIRLVGPHPGLRAGSEVALEGRVGPVPFRWTLRHTEVTPPLRFRDEQVAGPFHRWRHDHEFTARAAVSDLTDTIECSLPAAPVADRVAGKWVERRLARTLRYRHDTTAGDLTLAQRYSTRPLRVAITGASGLIGRTIRALLTTSGHTVVPLVRRAAAPGEISWDPDRGRLDPTDLSGLDAVVHLAGENIAGGRWTAARKQRILESRTRGTTLLAAGCARAAVPPRTLISVSAVGFYGDQADTLLPESAEPGQGFLVEVTRAWERAAEAARAAGIRVVHPRFGVVLTPAGGALKAMLPAFRAGVAGRLGSGKQWMSWVSIDDVAGALVHLLHTETIRGPVNVVAPHPATNAEFTRTLGRVLHRPTVVAVPAAAIKLVLGALGEEALLASARVEPGVLKATGYLFRWPELEPCLRHLLGRW